MIAAIDVGSTVGWARWDGARVTSGVREFPILGAPALRFGKFRAWATTHLAGTTLVVYEFPHSRNHRTTQFLMGLSAALLEACAVTGTRPARVHSLTIKKFTTGHGHAAKSEMYRHALGHEWLREQRRDDGVLLTALGPHDIAAMDEPATANDRDTTNNQVDAIAMLYYGARYFCAPPLGLPGELGYDAPPKMLLQKTKDEKLFERIAWQFDPSYASEADDD